MHRNIAIDWMRGIVMVLMALDHASAFFNQGRVANDTVVTHVVGSVFVVEQFFTRWVTHLSAPTFVFLTGTAMALSISQRRARGISTQAIDRDLLLRGIFIALLDVIILSWFSGSLYLQVLYAIGVSIIAMRYLHHINSTALLASALVLFIGGEAFTMLFWQFQGDVPLWLALTFAPWFTPTFTVLYPAVPWLSIMILGWVFGDLLTQSRDKWKISPARILIFSGIAAIICFLIVRWLNGYGNMLLYRENFSLIQWLHVSKYPPSLSYITLELGLMATILAVLMWLEPRITINQNGPILVFGQTALFFYLAHFIVLSILAIFVEPGGLQQAYFTAAITLVVLYPICWIYRKIKWRYPESLLRFV